MKKRGMLLLYFSVFLLSTLFAGAWADCTPSACPSGYIDNGITCNGGTCTRSCTALVCDTANWTSVHSAEFGFNVFVDEKQASSAAYTPSSNTSFCYTFNYSGPPNSVFNIQVAINNSPFPDCDTEMVGGFVARSFPWFSGMTDRFITGKPNSMVNDMRWVVRAHTEDGTGDAPSYLDDASKSGHIYCAPTTVACANLNSSSCDTDCYSQETQGHVVQGYYRGIGASAPYEEMIYQGKGCDNITKNLMNPVTYTVYQAPANAIQKNDQTCDRTNEPSIASNVKVIPLVPTAGQHLECNYTYTDPENFTEQNSSFQWWKNGSNQNIDANILGKGNLTVGNQWYCKVTPKDGLTVGSTVQSSNTLTVLSTVKDVRMYIDGKSAWNFSSGYLSGPEIVLNSTAALNDALESCTPDVQGYCTVALTYSSNDAGKLNLSALGIYYLERAKEDAGRAAIEHGINESLTNYALSTGQQIYVRYSNNTQRLGGFDKVVAKGNQTWAFNYITVAEHFTNITGTYNNTLVVWENTSLTTSQITEQVKALINKTKWQ